MGQRHASKSAAVINSNVSMHLLDNVRQMNTKGKGITLILMAVTFIACNQRPVSDEPKLYFDREELSDDDWADSLSNRYFSKELSSLDEPSLKDTDNRNEILRLTVFPSIIYIPYCIKLEKTDSLYQVSLKIRSDAQTFRASGLNGLSLTYQSDFASMDTIYGHIKQNLDSLNIFALNNATPEIVRKNKIQGADGTTYLLEYYFNRRYVALDRWNGFLEDRYYDKSDEFLELVRKLHDLVPSGVLPDLEAARQPADLKFEIFKPKL